MPRKFLPRISSTERDMALLNNNYAIKYGVGRTIIYGECLLDADDHAEHQFNIRFKSNYEYHAGNELLD